MRSKSASRPFISGGCLFNFAYFIGTDNDLGKLFLRRVVDANFLKLYVYVRAPLDPD